MSASLVGSEMCIRDSSARRASQRAARDATSGALSAALARVRALEEALGCLLYTSDAADDM
eukprot:5342970-Alexandrium_andersonii.AAC.1